MGKSLYDKIMDYSVISNVIFYTERSNEDMIVFMDLMTYNMGFNIEYKNYVVIQKDMSDLGLKIPNNESHEDSDMYLFEIIFSLMLIDHLDTSMDEIIEELTSKNENCKIPTSNNVNKIKIFIKETILKQDYQHAIFLGWNLNSKNHPLCSILIVN